MTNSEWVEACRAVKRRLGYDVLIPELQRMKTEGDKNLDEKRSLLIYGKMLRTENARLDQKLEEIRELCENDPSIYVTLRIIEVLDK